MGILGILLGEDKNQLLAMRAEHEDAIIAIDARLAELNDE